MSKKLNLYLVEPYDVKLTMYDRIVVVAANEEQARVIHPEYGLNWAVTYGKGWVPPTELQVEFLGTAKDTLEAGDVIAVEG